MREVVVALEVIEIVGAVCCVRSTFEEVEVEVVKRE